MIFHKGEVSASLAKSW